MLDDVRTTDGVPAWRVSKAAVADAIAGLPGGVVKLGLLLHPDGNSACGVGGLLPIGTSPEGVLAAVREATVTRGHGSPINAAIVAAMHETARYYEKYPETRLGIVSLSDDVSECPGHDTNAITGRLDGFHGVLYDIDVGGSVGILGSYFHPSLMTIAAERAEDVYRGVEGALMDIIWGERCNGIDDDCDGEIDEGITGCATSRRRTAAGEGAGR